ncbi:LYR motif-containing protein 2-like [Microdochium nivale]|nr:LYR motif-containing protein 2-like [Microdochium nivale]
MPPPIPHPETALHLYRHLLREATYLPGLCRSWISQRIQARYHDCRGADAARAKIYTKQAHGNLRYLRSATAGHIERLLHLCALATGRVGKRRRLLAKSELAREPPTSTASLEESSFLPVVSKEMTRATDENKPDQRKKPSVPDLPPDWLDNWSVDRLTTLAASQANKKLPHLITHDLRRTWDPEKNMTRENSYGIPIQARTERSRLRTGWARNFRALLPPLPKSEWEKLGDLVNGRGTPEDYRMPRRRPVARDMTVGDDGVNSSNNNSDDVMPGPGITWQDIITKPVRKLRHGSSRKMKSLTGLDEADKDPRGPGRPEGLRILGGRKMRRMLYTPVWESCPVMEKHPKLNKHKVAWGRVVTEISPPSSRELPFFSEVEEAGGKSRRPGAKGRGKGS